MTIDMPSENGHSQNGHAENGRAPSGGMRPPAGDPAGRTSLPGSPASTGMPSDAELTRLANSMFAVSPEAVQAPSSKGSGSSTMFNNASSSAFGIDEEQRLRSRLGTGAAAGGGHTPLSLATPSPALFPTKGAGGLTPEARSPSSAGAPLSSMSTPSVIPPSPFYFLNEVQSLSGGSARPLTMPALSHAFPTGSGSGRRPFDVNAVRRDFPILQQRVNGGKPLVWLDNAATTHKPRAVIERLVRYYETENSNIHRAAHELAARSTDAYEAARTTVARFLNAPSSKEIVFVRGATEAINLVAQTWGRQHVGKDDKFSSRILSIMRTSFPGSGCARKRAPR